MESNRKERGKERGGAWAAWGPWAPWAPPSLFSSFFLIAFQFFWILALSCNQEIRNSSDGLVWIFCLFRSWFKTGNWKPENQKFSFLENPWKTKPCPFCRSRGALSNGGTKTSARFHLTHFRTVQRYHFLQTAVSVSSVSGFSGFFVNRNRFGFRRFQFGFRFPVRFAAFLESPLHVNQSGRPSGFNPSSEVKRPNFE